MTRTMAYLSVLWLSMAGTAAAQAVVETGLGASRAATGAAPAKGLGKSLGGLAGSLDRALKGGQQGADAQPSAAVPARTPVQAPAPSGTAAAAPVPKFEDAGAIEPGLSYEELVRRFGPPAMSMTFSAERSLTYSGKDGMFQVRIQEGKVKSIEKPQS